MSNFALWDDETFKERAIKNSNQSVEYSRNKGVKTEKMTQFSEKPL